MSFFQTMKDLKTEVNNLSEKVNKLDDGLIEKARKYDDLKRLVSKIKFKKSTSAVYLNDKGTYGVRVKYNLPVIELGFDDNNNFVPDEMFQAINMLNFLGLNDMNEISEKLSEAQTKNIKQGK